MGVSLQFYHIFFQNCVPVFNEEVYENAAIKKCLRLRMLGIDTTLICTNLHYALVSGPGPEMGTLRALLSMVISAFA